MTKHRIVLFPQVQKVPSTAVLFLDSDSERHPACNSERSEYVQAHQNSRSNQGIDLQSSEAQDSRAEPHQHRWILGHKHHHFNRYRPGQGRGIAAEQTTESTVW